MSESSLSIGLPDLLSAVGFFLGFGSNSLNWTASQLSELTAIVQSGVRRVYYPPALNAQVAGYEWSWLHPNSYIDIVAPYATGTVTIVNGVVTLVGGTFPTWVNDQTRMSITGVSYQVDTRDSNSQVTLVDTSVNAVAGTIYQVAQFAYDLPDNFGRLLGGFHYPPEAYRRPISIISAGRIEDLQSQTNLTGTPHEAAVRYKSSDGTTGQRQEVMFYPTSSAPWTLSYEYEAYSGSLTDTFPYPLGGMQLAELYIESCLAVAETRVNDEIGQHAAQFQSLLMDAIARDRKRGAQMYGQLGHREHDRVDGDHPGWFIPPFPITYNGQIL
jgi:hypothetical protein